MKHLRVSGRNVLLAATVIAVLASGCAKEEPVTVAWLTLAAGDSVPEPVAAWFAGQEGYRVDAYPVSGGRDPDADILWLAIPDSAAWSDWAARTDTLAALANRHTGAGGGVLLSGRAALLPHAFGWETNAASLDTQAVTAPWFFSRKRGLQGLRGHPAFATGLHGGAFTWDPGDSAIAVTAGFFGDDWPEEGRVVGVEKRYVFLHPERKLLIEYTPGAGRAYALGGWFDLASRNRLSYRSERLLANLLADLAGEFPEAARSYWEQPAELAETFTPDPVEPVRPGRYDPDSVRASGLAYAPHRATDDPYSLGGRRVMLIGEERGGITDAWAHPVRILKHYRAALVAGEKLLWLDEQPCEVTVRPEALTRRYTTPVGTVTETIIPSQELPGAAVHYDADSPVALKLLIQHFSDLRWMWPYDGNALGTNRYALRDDIHALHVKDPSGDFHALAGAGEPAVQRYAGQDEQLVYKGGEFRHVPTWLNRIYAGWIYELDPERGLTYAFAATNAGFEDAFHAWRALIENPAAQQNAVADHVAALLDSFVTFDTPDPEFDRLTRWSLPAIDRLIVRTPGLGEALVAGFGSTERGWDGEHMVNGRPGYAWYFGRDAAWCAFAIDDYGDFATVRRQLEFFRDYQDLNGKIFHELSASGVVHYDAADSTPLYVILAADYLRHSGDLATIRVLWPSLVRAMDFLYSTDTDGDLLIENTDVGHGWVEGGPLRGANTTFYLAGLWARSLEDAAYIAGAIGEEGRARLFVDDAADVFAQLEADFWNEDGRFYAHGRNADGSFNPARTVLPAPVAWLNPLPAERIAPVLDAYASDEFSTDWGVRILSADSPDYNPGSYHGGAVWPLFTGWAALAEYKYGRAQAGFRHMMSNLRIKDRWARGYVEEVLHGAEYKPYGVCPHQGWSETGALHPAIDGLLGWEPDALAGRARIAPQLPADWDTLTVNNLRVGGTTLSLNLWRERGRIEWDVADRSGPPVEITMESPLGKRGTGADSEHDE